MMPGRMNPKQLSQLMRRFGINVKDIENVEQVIIQTDTQEYVFDDAEVTIMDAQGQKTYQISGTPRIVERKHGIPKEDIALVMEKTGKNEGETKKALEKTNGDIAEAILKLSST